MNLLGSWDYVAAKRKVKCQNEATYVPYNVDTRRYLWVLAGFPDNVETEEDKNKFLNSCFDWQLVDRGSAGSIPYVLCEYKDWFIQDSLDFLGWEPIFNIKLEFWAQFIIGLIMVSITIRVSTQMQKIRHNAEFGRSHMWRIYSAEKVCICRKYATLSVAYNPRFLVAIAYPNILHNAAEFYSHISGFNPQCNWFYVQNTHMRPCKVFRWNSNHNRKCLRFFYSVT